MKTIDFNLNAEKNGGKIVAFNYSRSLNELVGSWSAKIANGSFTAGDFISFEGAMKDGIITKTYKDHTGMWHLEGKDAGVKLIITTPEISSLPKGDAQTVIQHLADLCGLELVMQRNELGSERNAEFNVRSLISGSTCLEAILELAMMSGCIAFIDNDGKLNVSEPSTQTPNFQDIINDSESELDLDGYASHVVINLSRRKNEEDENDEERYIGTTPSTSTHDETVSGRLPNFGSYSVTTLMPFNVVKRVETSMTYDNITVKTKEEHEYDYRHKTVWRGKEEKKEEGNQEEEGKQEYVLFAFIEEGYELTKEITGNYGDEITFKETTTEKMDRDFVSLNDELNPPEDWKNENLTVMDKETIERKTTREGGKTPKDDMPDYAPEFDSKTTRKFKYNRDSRTCEEEEISYEMRQVGSISPVKVNGELIPHFLFNSTLAIQTHKTPEWVPVKTKRIYYEKLDDDGNCEVSTRTEYSDDGAEWLIEHGISDTGDEELDEYQKSYAKFSQQSHGLNVSFNSSGAFPTTWQFMELKGRMKVTGEEWMNELAQIGDISEYYENGEFKQLKDCPFYQNKKCAIYQLAERESDKCRGRLDRDGWYQQMYGCPNALKILEIIRKNDTGLFEKDIIGEAGNGNITYERDVYLDDKIKDEDAQSIANTIARNILKVKKIKGVRKSTTVPYDKNFLPNGKIVSVSHDWENMQSTVTYIESSNLSSDFNIVQSISSVASFITERGIAKKNIPKTGVVVETKEKLLKTICKVKVGNSEIECETKLKNIGKDDLVLLSFPSGNKLRGQVVARL